MTGSQRGKLTREMSLLNHNAHADQVLPSRGRPWRVLPCPERLQCVLQTELLGRLRQVTQVARPEPCCEVSNAPQISVGCEMTPRQGRRQEGAPTLLVGKG